MKTEPGQVRGPEQVEDSLPQRPTPRESETPAQWEGVYGGPNDPRRQDSGCFCVGEMTQAACINNEARVPPARPAGRLHPPQE